MTTDRKTLGISTGGAPRVDARTAFNPTGKRLETLKERARDMRREPSEAHSLLWEALNGLQLGGVKFQRHTVVGSAIVDFACPSRWIVIQLSPEGANAEVEMLQDNKLTAVGLRVLRFAEADVLAALEPVVAAINAEVNAPFDKRAARRGPAAKTPAPRFEDAEG